jgi:hypothetical protein
MEFDQYIANPVRTQSCGHVSKTFGACSILELKDLSKSGFHSLFGRQQDPEIHLQEELSVHILFLIFLGQNELLN